MLAVNKLEIKIEIMLESRIALDPPGMDDELCGVATLTPLDMAASRRLPNSDRWADDSVFRRALIDLAMMHPSARLLGRAID